MIQIQNIITNKLERLNKLVLVQTLNEKPLSFFRFEENPDVFCLIDSNYVASKNFTVLYFYSHYFNRAVINGFGEAEKDSFDKVNFMAAKVREITIERDIFYGNAFVSLNKIREKHTPKELFSMVLEKNIKVI